VGQAVIIALEEEVDGNNLNEQIEAKDESCKGNEL
jgi:hypothetical protein